MVVLDRDMITFKNKVSNNIGFRFYLTPVPAGLGWPGFPRLKGHPEGWAVGVKKEGLCPEHYYNPDINCKSYSSFRPTLPSHNHHIPGGALQRAREEKEREENDESDEE